MRDRARSTHAVELLSQGEGNAKLLAGGQTLGPMLNLRVVQPGLLVDIGRLPDTTRWSEDGEGVTIGACVTHAMIEDGKVPDPTGGVLRRVASRIAYRAVRNRGTIGGSLAHADPAADWLSSLSMLGAEAIMLGAEGERRVPVAELSLGIFETQIGEAEVLRGVRVRRLSPRARWGYYKFCRKTGDFAEAIGAVLHDPGARQLPPGAGRGRRRADRARRRSGGRCRRRCAARTVRRGPSPGGAGRARPRRRSL